MAAAALAIANESSQPAVVEELLLERERLAMDREALRSFVVERHYLRAPDFSEEDVWSWRQAFDLQAVVLQDIRDHARDIEDLAQGSRVLQASMSDLTRELDEAVELSSEIVGMPTAHPEAPPIVIEPMPIIDRELGDAVEQPRIVNDYPYDLAEQPPIVIIPSDNWRRMTSVTEAEEPAFGASTTSSHGHAPRPFLERERSRSR